jgi:predicted dehydrogenase
MLKVALVGTGRWGGNILRTLREVRGVEVVTFDKKKKATLKDIKELDAALVATPGSTHLDVALPFIKQGVPTYIEKPMTTSLRDARVLERAAKKSGAPIFVGHIHLYNEAFLKTKELIKGAGKIKTIHFEGMNNGPIRDDMSVLWDWGPHGVSMILDLLGKKPKHVQGWGYKTKLHDEVKARMIFANNIEATCLVSWISPEKRMKLVVIGSKYSVVLDDTADEKISVYKDGKVTYPKYIKRSPLENEIKAFIGVLKNKEKSHKTDVNNGLMVVKILSDIEKSMEFDGRRVKC